MLYICSNLTFSLSLLYIVFDYAKKTGDYAALSKTDLKLVALTYMMEMEVYGSIQVSLCYCFSLLCSLLTFFYAICLYVML